MAVVSQKDQTPKATLRYLVWNRTWLNQPSQLTTIITTTVTAISEQYHNNLHNSRHNNLHNNHYKNQRSAAQPAWQSSL